MNISEDVNILNGLQVCRDKIEAKHYLKAHGICMNEHELDALKSHCYTENEENTLTANQLNKVAGGVGERVTAEELEKSKARFDAMRKKLHMVEVDTSQVKFMRRNGSLSDIMKVLQETVEEQAKAAVERRTAELHQTFEEGKAEMRREFEKGKAEMHQTREQLEREVREKLMAEGWVKVGKPAGCPS